MFQKEDLPRSVQYEQKAAAQCGGVLWRSAAVSSKEESAAEIRTYNPDASSFFPDKGRPAERRCSGAPLQ